MYAFHVECMQVNNKLTTAAILLEIRHYINFTPLWCDKCQYVVVELAVGVNMMKFLMVLFQMYYFSHAENG